MTWFAIWRTRLVPFLVFCVTLTLWVTGVYALEVPPLQGRINDRANLLSPAVEQRLTERLSDYEKKTGHQLAVLTIPTLAGDPLEDFSIRVVEQWKLGKKGKDDGVLLLVVANDRKMRIEVGYGLEGDLPDALAGRIVRDEMAPRFRQGDFEGGIETAIAQIMTKTGGSELVPNTATGSPASGSGSRAQPNPLGKLGLVGVILAAVFKFAFFGIFLVVLVIVILVNLFGGGRSYRGRSGGIFLGGGGFGGGGFGGGGGFSGGGGGFGGGGASGNW